MMIEFKFELGDVVRDDVTGYTGTVTGRANFITSSDRFCVEAPVDDTGRPVPAEWFNASRLVKFEE